MNYFIKFIKIIVIFCLFVMSLILFAPKERLYFLFEKKMQSKDIIISDEVVQAQYFGLQLEKSHIFYNGILISNFNQANISLYGFYNSLSIDDTNFSGLIGDIIPSIQSLKITHHIFKPTLLSIKIFAQNNEVAGDYDMLNKKLILYFPKESSFVSNKFINKNLTLKDGMYVYEYLFASN